MAAADYTAVKSRFNTRLSDTSNVTFSSAEKDEFLTKAYNDGYNYGVTRDTSLATSSGTYSYTLPTGITNVFELYIDMDGTNAFRHPIERADYDVISTTLYIRSTLPSGRALLLVGEKKYTTSDSMPDLNQDYVLELAHIEALKFLKSKLATRFLKNDITMAEILHAIGE